MAKNKQEKKEIIDNIKDKAGKAKSIIFTKFTGLGVKENEALRQGLSQENSEYYVAKKTLFDLGLKDQKVEGLEVRKFDGRVAAVFGYEDEVMPAKVVAKFQKDTPDKIEFLGGVLEGKFLDAGEVTALSLLPTKQELYAKMVGSLNAPLSGLVNVLVGNIRGLVYVLNAIKKEKELKA